MFPALLFIASSTDPSDRRLDPFQFNYCIWNLVGFDSRGQNSEKEIADVCEVIYSHMSTCDVINLPGIYKTNTTNELFNQLKKKNIAGFQMYAPETDHSTTLVSRLDVTDIKTLPKEVSYPIKDSKCKYTGAAGTYDFSGSFYGQLKFHDPVNTTTLINVVFPTSESAELGCAIREALATEVCKIVKEAPANNDVFVGGTFAASPSEEFSNVITSCGLTRASKIAKKFSTNKKGNVTEDVYVAGGATKWLDVFMNTEQKDAVFSGQDPISYPVTLYVRQPLTARWKKFEIIYATSILCAAGAFFTWLLIFSRVKTSTGYDKIPEDK